MGAAAASPVLIAGGGIAGLTAALAFARKGFGVRLFEQATALEFVGAGIQLSPNATRILDQLNVLARLAPTAIYPDAVSLRRADDLGEIVRVPMANAPTRWGASYLTCHRGDLQTALLETIEAQPLISLSTSATVRDFKLEPPRLLVDIGSGQQEHRGELVIAADGVWSAIRAQGGRKGESRFIGQLAWRRTLQADDAAWRRLATGDHVVTAFLHPGFHLVAYPMSGGTQINLAGFTTYKQELPRGWSERVDPSVLRKAMRGASPALSDLAEDSGAWTAYPIHVADLDGSWSDRGGLALIGDAAHAMTPFAAQGAAMAIEDAATLAEAVAARTDDLPSALNDWTVARRRRVLRVARRGALNQFAWHAAGPVAMARDAFLKLRGPERLASDLDWLYGWRM